MVRDQRRVWGEKSLVTKSLEGPSEEEQDSFQAWVWKEEAKYVNCKDRWAVGKGMVRVPAAVLLPVLWGHRHPQQGSPLAAFC